jgi:outer membrane protein assembly factor BamB
MTMGPSGEILVYTLDTRGHWLSMWNSTKAIPASSETGSGAWQWRPDNYRDQTLDGSLGIEWNVTGNTAPGGSSFQWYWNGILVSQAIVTVPDEVFPTLVHVGFDTKTGQQLWIRDRTNMGQMRFPGYVTPNEGVYALFVRERKQWVAWDVSTGEELWMTDPIEDDWGFYQYTGAFAYGKFFSAGYDGKLHAYDATTGEHLWDYSSGDAGLDTPYGSWPLFGANIIADGKMIIGTNVHSPSMPLWRGEKLHVIDLQTGEAVWTIAGMYSGGRNGLGAVADGYVVTLNGYDNQIYCFGKGETGTTVAASPKISTSGSSVLIEGTVMDQSPGAKDTPAIADQYMSDWMAYLYMQQPCPTMVNGVEVKLETLDPNGNFYEIGTVTSDASGMYKLMWEPPVPGEYTIIATFEGSESYWRSYAETAVGVTEAPAAGGPIEPEPTEAPLITTELAIILAAVIVAVAVLAGFWIVRKRK